MKQFKAIFGIDADEVRKACVLMPFINKNTLKEFKIKHFTRGKLYEAGNSRDFTLIHSGIGSGLTGDAVLYLADNGCKNIILFGSCGLLESRKVNLDIGSLVSPKKSYSCESFSRMLHNIDIPPEVYSPDKELLENFLEFGKRENVPEVTSATIASLKLEEERAAYFSQKGIEVIDMECSAFFAAADYAKIKALAFFYVSDIINKKPFYKNLALSDSYKLSASIKRAICLLCSFIQENLSA